MKDLLTLLQRDANTDVAELAALTGMSPEEVQTKRKELEENGDILRYQAVVDWEKQGKITAIIEVSITPQGEDGFDRVARRISQYDQVESVYLMSSGKCDLAVMISGSTLQEIATFVAAHLAVISGVKGTSTQFILKKYKEHHANLTMPESEERELFIL